MQLVTNVHSPPHLSGCADRLSGPPPPSQRIFPAGFFTARLFRSVNHNRPPVRTCLSAAE